MTPPDPGISLLVTGAIDGPQLAEFGPVVPLTAVFRLMESGQCCRNALVTAWCHPQWRYAEGAALAPPGAPSAGTWIAHAFNVDDAGRVLDRTWPVPGLRYTGRVLGTDVAFCLLMARGL